MPVKTTTAVQTSATTASTVTADTAPNGFLVEKAEKTPEKRDFITVSTRDGHVFYLVIEYEGENKNVYFLNTVDTADLQRLLQSETANVQSGEQVQAETVPVQTEETKPVQQEPEKKNNNILLYALGVVAVVAFVFIAKKKVSGKKIFNTEDEESDNDDFTEEEPEIYEDDETGEENEEDE